MPIELPLTIKGSYEVPPSIRSGDALHSFNRRKSDEWGGYMLDGNPPEKWKKYVKRSHGSINDNLIKAYKEGYNPDIKSMSITIKGWKVEWSATIVENKEGKAFIDVSSRGSYSTIESDATNRAWLQIKKGGLSNSLNAADASGKSIEPWEWLYDLKYNNNAEVQAAKATGLTLSPAYIRQWFYKKTDSTNYPPHAQTKGTKDAKKKSTPSKSDVKVDYVIGDVIAAKVAKDVFGLNRYTSHVETKQADYDSMGFSRPFAQPQEIYNFLKSKGDKFFENKIVLLSTGLINNLYFQGFEQGDLLGSGNASGKYYKNGLKWIRKQLLFLKRSGAYVTILGVCSNNKTIYGSNIPDKVENFNLKWWNNWLQSLANLYNDKGEDGQKHFLYEYGDSKKEALENLKNSVYKYLGISSKITDIEDKFKEYKGKGKPPEGHYKVYTPGQDITIMGDSNFVNLIEYDLNFNFTVEYNSGYGTKRREKGDYFTFAGGFSKTEDGIVPSDGKAYFYTFKEKIAKPVTKEIPEESDSTVTSDSGASEESSTETDNSDGSSDGGGGGGGGGGTFYGAPPIKRIPVVDPFGVSGTITIRKVSGPGEIIGETVRKIRNIDNNRGADFEGIRFSEPGDYIVSATTDSLDVKSLTFSVRIEKEITVLEQALSRDVIEDNFLFKNTIPCIAQITPCKVTLPPIVLQRPVSNIETGDIINSIGIIPLVYFSGVPIGNDGLISIKLWHEGMIPRCSIRFKDKTGFIKTNPALDDTTFEVFIDSKSPNLKSIHMSFKVVDYKEFTEDCEYQATGVMNIPYISNSKDKKDKGGNGIYIQNYGVFDGTSVDTIKQISDKLGVGFNTNIDKSDDKMKWVFNGVTMEQSITEIIKHSYISEKSFVWGYFDYYYCFNLIDIEKELNRDNTNDMGVETSVGKLETKLASMKLLNDPSIGKSSFYFENYEMKNLSTSKSFGTGHSTKVKYYDVKKKEWLVFDVDGNTSDPTKNIILKGSLNEKELLDKNVATNFLGYIDTSNVHKNYHYAVVLNKRNIDDISKIQVKITLPNVNLTLYKGLKINITFVNLAPNIADPERIVWRLTGDWIISDIVYNYSVSTRFTQEIVCVRRELSKIPNEMQQPLAKLEAEREKTVNPEPTKFNQNYMVDQPYKFIDKNGKIYYVIVKSKSDDGNEMTGLVKIKKEIPKRTAKVEFKKCTDFPFEVGCQNDKIKDVQKWLGLSSDGSYGNDTYNKLVDLKYPVVITKEIYNQIKAEYESSQKKVEESKPVTKEETVKKTEEPVVTEKTVETKKEQNPENVKTGNNGELILIVGDSQSAVYLNGNTDGALKIDSNGELKYTFGPAKSSWPNYFSHNGAKLHAGVDVLALGAQTTGWMLNGSDKGPGLKTYLSKTKKKYTKIIIWGGGNDCTNGWDIDKVTVNNIQAMVDLGIKHGAKVYVCSGYKVEGVDGKGGLEAKGSGKIEYSDDKNDKGRIVGYEKYTQTNGSPVVWPAFGNWTKLTSMGTLDGPEDWKKRIALRKRLFDEVILNKIKRAYLIPTMDLQKNSSDGLHATAAGYKMAARKIMDALEGKNVINPK